MKKLLLFISLITVLSCNNSEQILLKGMLYYRNDLLTVVPCENKDITVNIIDSTKQIIIGHK